ncbi:hypothetical protein MUK42_12055 [Musa troglodytarum]|uniref:Uncharacterized protein n=1 Tax=Musa troglodytarum TaxID=320322 RepID=A0A9E7KIV1_9LILI|nr:hypothetical protein MUK42_12055 [Musa troglodytarum]URE19011.1 hypothetical protein MUK42_12055 [Musa troglodytarum]
MLHIQEFIVIKLKLSLFLMVMSLKILHENRLAPKAYITSSGSTSHDRFHPPISFLQPGSHEQSSSSDPTQQAEQSSACHLPGFL